MAIQCSPEVRARPVPGVPHSEETVLRKLGVAALAIPVLIVVYLASLSRRSIATRIGGMLTIGAAIGLLVVASLPPAASQAVPASGPPQPVAAQLLHAVPVGHGLRDPFEIRFDSPMDGPSVAAALRLVPESGYSLTWDAKGTLLRIAPLGHWQPGTLYVITVGAQARAIDGGTLSAPVRALVLTEHAGSGKVTAVPAKRSGARLDTTFRITLDRATTVAAIRAALRTEPPIAGDVTSGPGAGSFVFTPGAPLAPHTTYRIWLAELVDTAGVPFEPTATLILKTASAPSVVRFRPHNASTHVNRTSLLSVRFTARMDHASTVKAFRVVAGGKPVKGRLRWAEDSHVLVFDPASALPYGRTVRITVGPTATSASGVPLAAPAAALFRVEPKPTPTPKPKPKPTPKATATSTHIATGASGAVSGNWYAVEKYYLRLMNCTRTGGWVTSTGSCSSPGGRNVAPLALSSGISSRVSRPYAKLLATRGLCDHFVGGSPGDRLRRAGYTSYRWAENLGCRSGDPYAAVLGSHLFFQSEKSYSGGHYVNLMNSAYDRAGIGVWVYGGRVRLVVDFYHP